MHTNNGKVLLKASGVIDIILGILCVPIVAIFGVGLIGSIATLSRSNANGDTNNGMLVFIIILCAVVVTVFSAIMIVSFVFSNKTFHISRLQAAEAKLRTGGLTFAGVLQVFTGILLLIVVVKTSAAVIIEVSPFIVMSAIFLILPAILKFVAVSKIKSEELPELYGANPYGVAPYIGGYNAAPYGGGYNVAPYGGAQCGATVNQYRGTPYDGIPYGAAPYGVAPNNAAQYNANQYNAAPNGQYNAAQYGGYNPGYSPQSRAFAEQSLVQELERLATLRAIGVINNAEYEARKANLIIGR
ncbi:MAG: SHOCT domain-containing protein [Clostridiaceae bacterium]|jgi:hypothetical protein|nr:SHOCT domain-containing protein [Clostridiaceae bacterium]